MLIIDSPINVEKHSDNEVGIREDDRIMKARLQKYQILAEKSLDAIMFVDMEGNILEANDTSVKMYGYSFADFSLMTIFDLRSSDKKSLILKQMGTAATTGIIFETVHYRNDGTFFPVEVSSQGIIIDGKPTLVSIVRDITKRKLAEEALKRSEEKYRNLIENSHDIIYTLNPEGVFTFVSTGWTALLGHPLTQVIGKSFQPFVHPDDIANCESFLQKTIATGQRQTGVEYRVLHIDGSWRWHTTNAIPLWGDSDTVIGFQGNASDITARKQTEEELEAANERLEAAFLKLFAAQKEMEIQYQQLHVQEQALRDSEQRLADIINFLPDATMVIDQQGRVVFWNKAIEEMTGVTKEQIIGRGDYEYAIPFYGERRPFLLDVSLMSSSEYNAIKGKYDFIRQEGDRFLGEVFVPNTYGGKGAYLLVSSSKLYDLHGNTVGAIESIRDITARKRAEEEREESQRQLEQVIELLPDATLVIDQQGRVVFWNKAMEEMTGVSKDQMIGRGNYEYTIPFYGERRPTLIDLALMSSSECDEIKGKYDFIRQEGDTLFGEIYAPNTYRGKGAYLLGAASKLIDLAGHIVGAIHSVRDITERKELEKAKAKEAAIQKMTLLSIGDAVISTDNVGNIHLFNTVAEQLTGWTQEEAFGKPLNEVFNIINEFTRERCNNPVTDVLNTGKIMELANHTMLISKEGIERPIEDSAAPIIDDKGNINGVVLVFRDFTEKKERQAKIAYLSYHDQLTGLYNRRFFQEEAKRLDTERNLPITLVMGDINGLKLTNDAFGHLAGDKLLIKVAEVMKKECRTDDIIARIGGDEFMFLLPNTDSDEAKIIIQRINATLAQEKLAPIILSVSFGWETKKTLAEPMTTIYKKAEDHMYRHKLSESSSMRNKAIKVIISTLNEKNKREEQHSQRVSKLCADIGIALNLSAADVGELRTGGLMHDIGKIALDENILNKPGNLNEGEWPEIRRHAETGYRILSSVNEFSQLAEYVLAHHERWDGKGYPKGLKGSKIPLHARIMTVADAYDAMTSDRPYRKALSKEAVIEELRRNAGTQFDPDIVQVLLERVLRNGQWF